MYTSSRKVINSTSQEGIPGDMCSGAMCVGYQYTCVFHRHLGPGRHVGRTTVPRLSDALHMLLYFKLYSIFKAEHSLFLGCLLYFTLSPQVVITRYTHTILCSSVLLLNTQGKPFSIAKQLVFFSMSSDHVWSV